MADPISSTSGPSRTLPTPPAATDRTSNDQMGKDTFLKLLVAQLKFQNPMSPADPQSFMAQTAQFTMVEKLEEIARAERVLILNQEISTGSALIGKQVTYLALDGSNRAGLVTSAKVVDDGMQLRIGTDDVYLEFVKEVAAAPAAATSGPGTTGPTDPPTSNATT